MFGRKKVANVIVVEQPKAETIGTGIIIGSVGVAAGGALLKVTRKAVRFIFKGIYDTAKMIGGKISDWWARRKSEAEAERVAAEAAQAVDQPIQQEPTVEHVDMSDVPERADFRETVLDQEEEDTVTVEPKYFGVTVKEMCRDSFRKSFKFRKYVKDMFAIKSWKELDEALSTGTLVIKVLDADGNGEADIVLCYPQEFADKEATPVAEPEPEMETIQNPPLEAPEKEAAAPEDDPASMMDVPGADGNKNKRRPSKKA